MSINIVVPEVGESIVDARVAKWLKKEGDRVAAGEPLVELETDKVDVEVSAPKAGVLKSIAHGDGADVKVGEILGILEGMEVAKGTEGAERRGTEGQSERGTEERAERGAELTTDGGTERPATPSARRLAREKDVAIADVKASGPRVTRADIEQAARNESRPEPAPVPAPQSSRTASVPSSSSRPSSSSLPSRSERSEERVRMSKRRATIAKRLLEAQQTAALLTTFNEIDMSGVMSLRERQKEAFKARYGVSLGIASFFVKASIAALRDFPRLNAEIDGDEMVLKHYYDIGIAVGAAEGLVVPVLRDADRLTFAEIETRIRDFAKRAADGTLTIDDLRGGTFSITNGGVYGSLMSTPIVNPPQVGILGLHAIKERPIGLDGQLALRPMMYVALTYDHRIVDGAEAVRFLVRIKELVEEPALLSIES
jgi:2-oxoglutarate dehydrogenase E2 component (dihydrolipoamide succinyltransferase)